MNILTEAYAPWCLIYYALIYFTLSASVSSSMDKAAFKGAMKTFLKSVTKIEPIFCTENFRTV